MLISLAYKYKYSSIHVSFFLSFYIRCVPVFSTDIRFFYPVIIPLVSHSLHIRLTAAVILYKKKRRKCGHALGIIYNQIMLVDIAWFLPLFIKTSCSIQYACEHYIHTEYTLLYSLWKVVGCLTYYIIFMMKQSEHRSLLLKLIIRKNCNFSKIHHNDVRIKMPVHAQIKPFAFLIRHQCWSIL